ncbi:hypothetical protein LTR84_010412 [Exophiala bonariae]|uniref:Uncharacterized protein n=1 Tax=Exophiala bonariae TaxID=1690606 RepID=A0AAV9MTR7_9EURO|nr:hypothetical protein LTR84_010412 [Exophiala bonariae]
MKTSPSHLVRNFLKAIHPPLPPTTARETKKLVGVLESAFQKHLDEIHPSPQTASSGLGSHESNPIPDPAHQATRATHLHLASLLAHPLLQKQPAAPSTHRSLTATAVSEFENVGSWKAYDFALVQRCCRLYLDGLKRKEIVPPAQRLGPRLLSWYTHMSTTEKCNFLADTELPPLVVPVLYADDLEAEVWDMLRILYERPSLSKAFAKSSFSVVEQSRISSYHRAEDNLISLMIHQATFRESVVAGAQQFVQACKYHESRNPSDGNQPINLGRSWNRLAQAMLDRRSTSRILPELFDEVVFFGSRCFRQWAWSPSCLQLYHPSVPSYKPLMTYLESYTTHTKKSPWANKGKPLKTLVTIINDAVALAESQGRPRDARKLNDIKTNLIPSSSYRPELQAAPQTKHSEPATSSDTIPNLGLAWT